MSATFVAAPAAFVTTAMLLAAAFVAVAALLAAAIVVLRQSHPGRSQR
jgi:hypothetical protein